MMNKVGKVINPFVEDLIRRGTLKTPSIISAFKDIDRANFVREKALAYIDEPLSIGEGQTISQPTTVAFMLELLKPEAGNKVFEIGFGSGWQTALLAYIVSQKKSEARNPKSETKGKVYAVERVKELFEWGAKNIAKYNFIKKGIVEVIYGDATKGLAEHAPYDRIIAAAAGEAVPESWLKELKVGGRLVAPVKGSIWLYIKRSRDKFDKKEYKGFIFVPLVSDRQ